MPPGAGGGAAEWLAAAIPPGVAKEVVGNSLELAGKLGFWRGMPGSFISEWLQCNLFKFFWTGHLERQQFML